jgi:hypothetical protein
MGMQSILLQNNLYIRINNPHIVGRNHQIKFEWYKVDWVVTQQVEDKELVDILDYRVSDRNSCFFLG